MNLKKANLSFNFNKKQFITKTYQNHKNNILDIIKVLFYSKASFGGNMPEFLEAFMLICFGLSWPINVMKNIKAKTAKNMRDRKSTRLNSSHL